jgi:hypothetical protein
MEARAFNDDDTFGGWGTGGFARAAAAGEPEGKEEETGEERGAGPPCPERGTTCCTGRRERGIHV